jgi:hypothetical protein
MCFRRAFCKGWRSVALPHESSVLPDSHTSTVTCPRPLQFLDLAGRSLFVGFPRRAKEGAPAAGLCVWDGSATLRQVVRDPRALWKTAALRVGRWVLELQQEVWAAVGVHSESIVARLSAGGYYWVQGCREDALKAVGRSTC